VAKVNNHGNLVVMGSAQAFDDQFLGKEDNAALLSAVVRIMNDDLKLEAVDEDAPEFGDKVEVPDTETLAERLRGCLEDQEELPADFTQLFDHAMFQFDFGLVPQVKSAHERLGVKPGPLTLIQPQFEVPHPPLQPAVFLPVMRELPPPSLELFDLDNEFTSERVRLAQHTNKCTDNDLEFYVRGAGQILGVAPQLTAEKRTAKHVLEFVFKELVRFKKIDQELPAAQSARALTAAAAAASAPVPAAAAPGGPAPAIVSGHAAQLPSTAQAAKPKAAAAVGAAASPQAPGDPLPMR
jgi:intraflagellar transport protein 52